jgi:hypothetical protein
MKKINPPSPPFRKGGMGGFENHLHPPPCLPAGIQGEGNSFGMGGSAERLLLGP